MAKPITAADVAGMDREALLKALAEARAEAERLKARGVGKLTCKVSEKGALSVYGLGRWPITLYRGQWERLIPFIPEITKFIGDHAAQLKEKE